MTQVPKLLAQSETWSKWLYRGKTLFNTPAVPDSVFSLAGVYVDTTWLAPTVELAAAVIDTQLAGPATPDDYCRQRLHSREGLCTSIAKTDEHNALVIRYVLAAYLSGTHLQACQRADSLWHDLLDLPQDFCSYRFRTLLAEQDLAPEVGGES